MVQTVARRTHAHVIAAAEQFAAAVKPGAAERDRCGAVPRAEIAEFRQRILAAPANYIA